MAPTPSAVPSSVVPARKPKPKGGFGPNYRLLPPIRKLAWLDGPECKAMVLARQLQQSKVEAEKRRLRKESTRVSRIVPSPCRLQEFENGQPFPPRAENTPMQLPREAFTREELEQFHPPQHLTASGATYDLLVWHDCQRKGRIEGKSVRAGRTESVSTAAIESLEREGAIVVSQVKLASESEEVLKRQISRYLEKASRPASAPAPATPDLHAEHPYREAQW